MSCFVGGMPHRGPKLAKGSGLRSVIFVVVRLRAEKFTDSYSQIRPCEPELTYAILSSDRDAREEWLQCAKERANSWVHVWKELKLKASYLPSACVLKALRDEAEQSSWSQEFVKSTAYVCTMFARHVRASPASKGMHWDTEGMMPGLPQVSDPP